MTHYKREENYLPENNRDKALWLNNFKNKLEIYADTLGVSSAMVQQVRDDAEAFKLILIYADAIETYKQEIRIFINQLSNGTELIVSFPNEPAVPVFSPNVTGGIFGRIARLVRVIKAHPHYTRVIGIEFRIV